jgi:hypothetical protein
MGRDGGSDIRCDLAPSLPRVQQVQKASRVACFVRAAARPAVEAFEQRLRDLITPMDETRIERSFRTRCRQICTAINHHIGLRQQGEPGGPGSREEAGTSPVLLAVLGVPS